MQYPNNDGIHINSSKNVFVSNCNIVCGDDCIVIRANNYSLPENKVCDRVTVTNCTLTSYSGCIRIGWLCDGTIRNCTFSNLVMTDASCGVSVLIPDFCDPRIPDQGRESPFIENLNFSDIVMDGVYGNPIYVEIFNKKPAPPRFRFGFSFYSCCLFRGVCLAAAPEREARRFVVWRQPHHNA